MGNVSRRPILLRRGVLELLAGNNKIEVNDTESVSVDDHTRFGKVISIGWLGQTAASLCWILSVFAYGISSTGDWLQLLAASSWMVSNIATIVSID